MGNIETFLVLILIIVVIVYFRNRHQKKFRFKFHEIQQELAKSGLFARVETSFDDEYIIATYKSYTTEIYIRGSKELDISLKAISRDKIIIYINWEPITLTYNSFKHIGYHLALQISKILCEEEKISHDKFTLSVEYNRKIPIEKSREYNRDMNNLAESYYDL